MRDRTRKRRRGHRPCSNPCSRLWAVLRTGPKIQPYIRMAGYRYLRRWGRERSSRHSASHTRIKQLEWLGIGHTRIKHSPQVNWDQSTRSLLGCLKDPLISSLIQNISFEINRNLSLLCLPGSGSFSHIHIDIHILYTFALSLVLA